MPDRPTSAPPAPLAPPLVAPPAAPAADTQAAAAAAEAAAEAEYRALASGDCSAVLAWLRRLGLQKYAPSFQQQAADGGRVGVRVRVRVGVTLTLTLSLSLSLSLTLTLTHRDRRGCDRPVSSASCRRDSRPNLD